MMKRTTVMTLVIALVVGGALFAQSEYEKPSKPAEKKQVQANNGTVVNAARNSQNLSVFSSQVQQTELAKTLEGQGPYTVFAPTDAAFKSCTEEEQAKLKDKATLTNTLESHVVPGKALTTADLAKMNGQKLKTLDGKELAITVQGEHIKVGDAMVMSGADITAGNGIVHPVDVVMLSATDVRMGAANPKK